MEKTAVKQNIVAVIDIGTSAIRMVVAEIDPKTRIRYLENLQKPVRFGTDVFTTGRISTRAMREAVEILQNYKHVIDSYGVSMIQAVATSAVREAQNRDNIVDQIFVRTGIDVEVIGGSEQNRLELIAVEDALEGGPDLEKKNCLIVEVGSGSTEMIILNKGKVEVTHTLPIGSIRLPEQAVMKKLKPAVLQRILKRNIHETTVLAAQEYDFDALDTFIALGGEMRFAALQLTEKTGGRFVTVSKKDFLGLVSKMSKLTPEDISEEYGLPITQAETLNVALIFYVNFLNRTKAEEIVIPMVSIRDGLLLELEQTLSGYKRTDVAKQVISSARHLGEKYKYDKNHASNVTALAVKLFDLLKEDHGLGSKQRLLLEISGILHDIGTYISPSGHHKHSFYLVNAAELFGLRKNDKDIVSNIVRYHRRAVPKQTHVSYMSLARQDRAIVSKLSAILRVADAMDNSHQQKIKNITLERSAKAYTIWVEPDIGDISLERESLGRKGQMFVDVFGVPIELKQGKPRSR
jgi:exopolyphosphatase/guanosine-5'-triphosphate,3'-diphosphate pyrophosphatase